MPNTLVNLTKVAHIHFCCILSHLVYGISPPQGLSSPAISFECDLQSCFIRIVNKKKVNECAKLLMSET